MGQFQATITEYQANNAALSYIQNGAVANGWVTTTLTGAISGANCMKTGSSGNDAPNACVFTIPNDGINNTSAMNAQGYGGYGRAVYMLAYMDSLGGAFKVNVDNNDQNQFGDYVFSQNLNYTMGNFQYARVLIPIARGLNDLTPHTIKIMFDAVNAGLYFLYIDSFWVVSGPPGTPDLDRAIVYLLGDSWTRQNTGVNMQGATYGPQLGRRLQAELKCPVIVTQDGVTGSCLHGVGANVGGMYRLKAAIQARPRILCSLFGTNDLGSAIGLLAGALPTDFARHNHAMCCLIEDCVDTTQTQVCISTPPYNSTATWKDITFNGTNYNGYQGMQMMELAADEIFNLQNSFQWLRVADVYGAFCNRPEYVYPNGVGDFGLHPNEIGHGRIATEFYQALRAKTNVQSAQWPTR